jgi:CubicO group peptidase (beta-lactamase class C family)
MRSAITFVIFVLCATAQAADDANLAQPRASTIDSVRSAITELEKLTKQTLEKTGVPGLAVAVVYDDKVAYQKGFGVRQAGKNEPVDADTVFQLASVSKPFTSTVLAALVGEGAIHWDDAVIDHDPSFEMFDAWVTRQLTLRDLLCHRTGLADHAGDLLEDLGYDQPAVLYRLRFLKPASSFRSAFAYTNYGYTEAAVAGAKAVGKPWDVLAAEKLYKPLGMKSTSSRYQDYTASKNHAVIHARVDGKWVAKNIRNADAQSPAGGVSSSVRDVAQWLRLQLADGKFDGKQLIAAGALRETHRPQMISSAAKNPDIDRTGCYGLGWNVNVDDHGRVRLNHSGGFDLGAATVVFLVPSENLGVVVLSNASPIGVPEALGATFCDLAIDGKPQRDWFTLYRKGFEAMAQPSYGTEVDYNKPQAEKHPPLANLAYVGKYSNQFFGDIEVTEQNGSLTLRMGPKKTAYSMQHYDHDTFTYQPVGEMSAGKSAVTFTIGPSQTASQVLIENLDAHGAGTFIKQTSEK